MSGVSVRHQQARGLHQRIQFDLEALETEVSKQQDANFVDALEGNIHELQKIVVELKSLTVHDGPVWHAYVYVDDDDGDFDVCSCDGICFFFFWAAAAGVGARVPQRPAVVPSSPAFVRHTHTHTNTRTRTRTYI